MENIVRARVVVTGRVQGVFFRMETKRTADRWGVAGWVKNRRDGAVEAVFEGEKKNVLAIVEWCKTGPPHSKVEDIDIKWEDATEGLEGFYIKY
ncbi:MAG TPA: acylphosphatase [Desulfobacterales bacterium]|nr:acylphosphatase [Desulfobacterales bacterium]